MIDPIEGGRREQGQQEDASTDTGATNDTDTSTATQDNKAAAGHKTKSTSWKVGFFVEKVETQTSTPPDYGGGPVG